MVVLFTFSFNVYFSEVSVCTVMSIYINQESPVMCTFNCKYSRLPSPFCIVHLLERRNTIIIAQNFAKGSYFVLGQNFTKLNFSTV